jgi:hypothetical protein
MTTDPKMSDLPLWRPLLRLLTIEQRREAERIWRKDMACMIAWGTRTGYFSWAVAHPDATPSWAQFREWTARAHAA